jgi:hypothetical protein
MAGRLAFLRALPMPIEMRVSVAPEGITQLVALGWVNAERMRSRPTPLADPVAALASAALAAGYGRT